MAITIRKSAITYAGVQGVGVWNSYTGFHGIQGISAFGKHLPGSSISFKVRSPGGNNYR
jgi:hypothetical protein